MQVLIFTNSFGSQSWLSEVGGLVLKKPDRGDSTRRRLSSKSRMVGNLPLIVSVIKSKKLTRCLNYWVIWQQSSFFPFIISLGSSSSAIRARRDEPEITSPEQHPSSLLPSAARVYRFFRLFCSRSGFISAAERRSHSSSRWRDLSWHAISHRDQIKCDFGSL